MSPTLVSLIVTLVTAAAVYVVPPLKDLLKHNEAIAPILIAIVGLLDQVVHPDSAIRKMVKK